MAINSRIPGFHKLSIDERLAKIKEIVDLKDIEVSILRSSKPQVTIENIIGVMTIPIGVATNFQVDGIDRLVTMAVEEASVVAAASNAAKMTRDLGGFITSNTGSIMIGQIQLLEVPNPNFATQQILSRKDELIELANEQDPVLLKFGGGAIDIETRVIESATGTMLIVHLLVDALDAMGANAVNTMVESLAPVLEEITQGTVLLRIISNLADRRIVRARAVFDKEMLGGEDVVYAMVDAWAFADADPYRAATHNKGIMNAISAITLATANDWRAIEAGAHAYAARFGYYGSLTNYEVTDDGHLAGSIELPLAIGTVGGATRVHPVAQTCLKIMGVNKSHELAAIVASAGLAQNVAALRALCSEGIQKGHMKLHAINLAKSVEGITDEEVGLVVDQMIKEEKIRADRAVAILKEMRDN